MGEGRQPGLVIPFAFPEEEIKGQRGVRGAKAPRNKKEYSHFFGLLLTKGQEDGYCAIGCVHIFLL